MSGLQFRIQYPDGRHEQLAIDSDSVLIGSGAHCEIRLPPEHAAVDHVLITFLGGAVYAQARFMNPPPTINGAPFTQASILPESVLAVGGVRLTVGVLEELGGGDNVIKRKEKKTSPVLLVAAAIVVPFSLIVLLRGEGRYGIGEVPAPPALWGEPPAVCPQQAKDLALNLAQDKRILAEGKRERCPFHIQDCVETVPNLDLAAVCFRTAGEEEASKEAAFAGVAMRERVNEMYRGHQMRLEHTITVGDLQTAQKQVKILLAMLEGQSAPYIVWLSNHERKLALRLGRKKGK